MISMMRKTPIWAATRSGSYAVAPASCLGISEPGMTVDFGATALLAGNAPRLRDERRQAQPEQGKRAVFGSGPIARTAHVAATESGLSGPYPWRQPV